MFTIHMENLTDASIRLKIYQDKTFKTEKNIDKLMSTKLGVAMKKKI